MTKSQHDIPLALYVHIPWCERKCPYCDFNSHEHFDPSLESPYVAALLQDLELQTAALPPRPLTSVFIGGGTPSLFSGSAIARLLNGIDQVLGLGNAEITLESNPGSAEAGRYADYRAAGVNRLSIGVQSFDDTALARLGRIHNADQARAATELAAKHFDRFNLDLMHGLPDQTLATARSDLEEGIKRAGGHLSWYQLTIEPNTAFWSRPPEIPVEDTLADIQDMGEELLNTAGFTQYEVSAWSHPCQKARHNLNYWTFGDYIGIGAGAHGKLTRESTGVGNIHGHQSSGDIKEQTISGQGSIATADPNIGLKTITRTHHTRLPTDYLKAIDEGRKPITNIVNRDDLPGEFVLNALRLTNGVPIELLTQRTGLVRSSLQPMLDKLVAKGLMLPAEKRLQTTPLGFRFLNDVIGSFLQDRD